MKSYAYIVDGIVRLVYSEDEIGLWDENIKTNSVEIPSDTHVAIGWSYENNVFTDKHNATNKSVLEHLKVERIDLSKSKLTSHLEDNPLQFADGKFYSVTADKQSLLANALQVYQMKIAAGLPATLKWNTTGEECTEWTIEGLSALALAIAYYVEPLVAKQQALEVQIKKCQTVEELNAIEINYEMV